MRVCKTKNLHFRLVSKIRKKDVKYHKIDAKTKPSRLAMLSLENVTLFIQACQEMQIAVKWNAKNLEDNNNLNPVLQTIVALSEKVDETDLLPELQLVPEEKSVSAKILEKRTFFEAKPDNSLKKFVLGKVATCSV